MLYNDVFQMLRGTPRKLVQHATLFTHPRHNGDMEPTWRGLWPSSIAAGGFVLRTVESNVSQAAWHHICSLLLPSVLPYEYQPKNVVMYARTHGARVFMRAPTNPTCCLQAQLDFDKEHTLPLLCSLLASKDEAAFAMLLLALKTADYPVSDDVLQRACSTLDKYFWNA